MATKKILTVYDGEIGVIKAGDVTQDTISSSEATSIGIRSGSVGTRGLSVARRAESQGFLDNSIADRGLSVARIATSFAVVGDSIADRAESIARVVGDELSYYDLSVSQLYLDDVDIGIDYGSAFNMIACVDFEPTETGSAWGTINLGNSNFDISKDILVDIQYVPDGIISTNKAFVFTTKIWVADLNSVIVSTAPDSTQTRTLTVVTTDTGINKEYSSFHVVPNSELSENSRLLVLKLTRYPSDSGDTYDGTIKLTRVVIRQ